MEDSYLFAILFSFATFFGVGFLSLNIYFYERLLTYIKEKYPDKSVQLGGSNFLINPMNFNAGWARNKLMFGSEDYNDSEIRRIKRKNTLLNIIIGVSGLLVVLLLIILILT